MEAIRTMGRINLRKVRSHLVDDDRALARSPPGINIKEAKGKILAMDRFLNFRPLCTLLMDFLVLHHFRLRHRRRLGCTLDLL